ncbi:FAD:protein FMN transferase [Piscinibacter aquaticus]|uniref:FAD:protein FMN transferase n=1 Tax=Piscinibacter aquaticus TaxID=392597 RepID=A0A5C6U3D8_9BURK|nr:FAD:protein FMN transferase [Piscinibacter aquaticus]
MGFSRRRDAVRRRATRGRAEPLAGRFAEPRAARVARGTVASRNVALQLDFGAVAKGVAIDRALDRLQAAGVRDAIVDLGGNLAAMGHTVEAGEAWPWQIGIRDPHGPGLVATLAPRGREAVVTSGSYERHREADGRRVTHILDPHTAVPAAAWVSVTVLHPPRRSPMRPPPRCWWGAAALAASGRAPGRDAGAGDRRRRPRRGQRRTGTAAAVRRCRDAAAHDDRLIGVDCVTRRGGAALRSGRRRPMAGTTGVAHAAHPPRRARRRLHPGRRACPCRCAVAVPSGRRGRAPDLHR